MHDSTLYLVRRIGSTAVLFATERLSEANVYRNELGGDGITIEAIALDDVRPAA